MSSKIHNLHTLRLAKIELKEEIRAREARLEHKAISLKNALLAPPKEEKKKGFFSKMFPSSIKSVLGGFILNNVVKPKTRITSDLTKIISTVLLK